MLFRKFDVIIPPETISEATEGTSIPISQVYPTSQTTVTTAALIATAVVLAVATFLIVRKIKANSKHTPYPRSESTITEETES